MDIVYAGVAGIIFLLLLMESAQSMCNILLPEMQWWFACLRILAAVFLLIAWTGWTSTALLMQKLLTTG